ncbi:MAG TPA: copper amine oxidase N-terminal domain-containing protein [Acetivibrio sp.]|jgi:hypothetical protein|nr:copper amine oxidase N-terminal domain-containing protein [Acetivibrio sp.]HPT90021.1 copper amine oxidase N-terminal domain-containing protein [Acetivibrio sp.]
MKKIISLLVVLIIAGVFLTTNCIAYELPLCVFYNGDEIVFPDQQPFIDSHGRTQAPARFIGEKLGATVTWDGIAKKATFERGSDKLVLYVDKRDYTVNGVKKQMDTVALNIEGRIFVPVRYVAEAFGATVTWEPSIKTVYITLNKTGSNNNNNNNGKEVGGFKIPADTNLVVTKVQAREEIEAKFEVNLLRDNFEKQKADLKEILLQKFEPEIVDQIMNHINQKKVEEYILPEKVLYSAKNDQYIWIKESRFIDINIVVYVKGFDFPI